MSRDKDIIIYSAITPTKTLGMIKNELLNKAGNYKLTLWLLQSGEITLSDFVKLYPFNE